MGIIIGAIVAAVVAIIALLVVAIVPKRLLAKQAAKDEESYAEHFEALTPEEQSGVKGTYIRTNHEDFKKGLNSDLNSKSSDEDSSEAFKQGREAAAPARTTRMIAGIVAAVAVITAIGCGIFFAVNSANAQPSDDQQEQSQSQQSEADQQSVEEATEEATNQLASSVNEAAENQRKANEAAQSNVTAGNLNIVQANAVFPVGERILMSQESLPTNYTALRQATGLGDATALPHSTAEANQAAALQDLMKECYDKSAGSTNTPYVLGTLDFFRAAYNIWFGCEPDMPELIRLTDLYRAQGITPFALTNAKGEIILTSDGLQWYANDDAKIAAAMFKALYDEMAYGGVGGFTTLMNYHGNSALDVTDHRITENPKQYAGKFHIWNLVWKGQNLFQFGTNCGSAEGPGDKRPALFTYPEPEATPSGGGNPGTGGGGNPPTGNNTPPVNPPTDKQEIKNPDKGSAPSGNAPVGGGKGEGTTQLEDDHPATSSGASPDASNDDGTSKPSNGVQDRDAAQDNSTAPATDPISVTNDTTVTDNSSGQTTNTSKENPNKGKVDPD